MVIGPDGKPRFGTGAGLTKEEIESAIPLNAAARKQEELRLSAPTPKRARPNRKTVRAAIRGSVPGGKLKRAKIVLADKDELKNSPVGGYTQYDPKNRKDVIKLGAPTGDDAEGITIRGHETRHATRHTPTRKKPVTELEALVGQIVDDVNIESTELPHVAGIKAYKRAHLATAMKGVRTIRSVSRKAKSGEIPDTVALRNGQLIHAVRALGMLKHYAGTDGGDFSLVSTRNRGMTHLRDAIGHRMLKAIWVIVNTAKMRRHRAKAISMLLALMEREEPKDREDGREEMEDGEILSPVEHGDATDGKMELLDLRPKSVYCAKEKSVSRRYSPSGVIINPTRYLPAIVSGDSNGLFSKRLRIKPGGCVVIDASGSMGASKANLSALCKLIPTATVGYYSGHSNGRGILAIYADGGKRFNSELPNGTLKGGNAVDLPAIRWLMKHPKPWTLVSDLEFCGGTLGSEFVAHVIVERAVKRGDLKVYRSLDEAFDAFGGKGNMPN